MRGSTLAVEVEDHALPGAQEPEYGADQRIPCKVDLAEVGIAHDDPLSGTRVVRLDYALHLWLLLIRIPAWVLPPYGFPETVGKATHRGHTAWRTRNGDRAWW